MSEDDVSATLAPPPPPAQLHTRVRIMNYGRVSPATAQPQRGPTCAGAGSAAPHPQAPPSRTPPAVYNVTAECGYKEVSR